MSAPGGEHLLQRASRRRAFWIAGISPFAMIALSPLFEVLEMLDGHEWEWPPDPVVVGLSVLVVAVVAACMLAQLATSRRAVRIDLVAGTLRLGKGAAQPFSALTGIEMARHERLRLTTTGGSTVIPLMAWYSLSREDCAALDALLRGSSVPSTVPDPKPGDTRAVRARALGHGPWTRDEALRYVGLTARQKHVSPS